MKNLKAYVILLLFLVGFIIASVPTFLFVVSVLIIAFLLQVICRKNFLSIKIM